MPSHQILFTVVYVLCNYESVVDINSLKWWLSENFNKEYSSIPTGGCHREVASKTHISPWAGLCPLLNLWHVGCLEAFLLLPGCEFSQFTIESAPCWTRFSFGFYFSYEHRPVKHRNRPFGPPCLCWSWLQFKMTTHLPPHGLYPCMFIYMSC